MNLSIGDIVVVLLYFLAIAIIGYFASRNSNKSESDEEYILAGRRITLPFFVASLVATWYGNIMGMGEFVYSFGIVAFFCFGLPYYIAAYLFAIFIAKRIRSSASKTIPEQISRSYGNQAGFLSSGIILIITIPAAYILMLGSLVQMFTGWDLWLSLVIGTALSLAFIYHGGLKADIFANSLQFIFMYIGFGALLYFAISEFGSISTMLDKLPAGHKQPIGTLSWQYVIAWYIIAFQTFIDPSFHQRCASADSPKTASRGILISIGFWIVFDFLTLFTGLYAAAYFSIEPALNAYPVLADKILPNIWKGFFLVALIATVMSTLESYAFISATTFGNDILPKILKHKRYSNKSLTKFGLIITGIIGIFMALAVPSAIDLIYKTSSIAVPAIIFPLVISYSKRYSISSKQSLIIMISSITLSSLWTLSNEFSTKFNLTFLNFTSIFEPMIPGILLSIILGLSFVSKRTE